MSTTTSTAADALITSLRAAAYHGFRHALDVMSEMASDMERPVPTTAQEVIVLASDFFNEAVFPQPDDIAEMEVKYPREKDEHPLVYLLRLMMIREIVRHPHMKNFSVEYTLRDKF